MTTPEVMLGIVDQVWTKQMRFVSAGDVHEGHSHIHDHMTLLAKGALEVTVEGNVTTFTAPHIIVIRKDKVHTLKALEADTIAYCIHALRDKTGDIVDDTMFPKLMEPLAHS